MMLLTKNKLFTAGLLSVVAFLAYSGMANTATAASWALAPAESRLNFMSIKKINMIETHQFNSFTGEVDANGKFILTVDLASVDTNNEIRDGRMKEFLFDVSQYAKATVTGQLDMLELDAIAEGANIGMIVDAQLDLHGQSKMVSLDLVVTRLVGAKMAVAALQPIVLNVGDFALVAGVEKLKELANLPSISHAVPVSFFLTFKFVP